MNIVHESYIANFEQCSRIILNDVHFCEIYGKQIVKRIPDDQGSALQDECCQSLSPFNGTIKGIRKCARSENIERFFCHLLGFASTRQALAAVRFPWRRPGRC